MSMFGGGWCQKQLGVDTKWSGKGIEESILMTILKKFDVFPKLFLKNVGIWVEKWAVFGEKSYISTESAEIATPGVRKSIVSLVLLIRGVSMNTIKVSLTRTKAVIEIDSYWAATVDWQKPDIFLLDFTKQELLLSMGNALINVIRRMKPVERQQLGTMTGPREWIHIDVYPPSDRQQFFLAPQSMDSGYQPLDQHRNYLDEELSKRIIEQYEVR